MKKFFASLLALVGMVAGLTLTSCGGGGGGGDSNLVGLQVSTAGTTPGFTLQFEERYAPQLNMYTCSYTLGRSMTTGSFAMANQCPRMEGNEVVIEGAMGFVDGGWLIQESNATTFFGLNGDADEGCRVTELKVTIRFDEDGNGTMKFEGKGYGFHNDDPMLDQDPDPDNQGNRIPQTIDITYVIGVTEGAKRFHSGVEAQ